MLCIHLKVDDPYYCLAAEEYLLKHFTDDIFMLWQSSNAVVLGKHQCAPAEINYPFVRENKITVARRISGGGTVFHDRGNVNFTFIKNVGSPSEINFRNLTLPVVATLGKLGVEAVHSGRNDLLIEGFKISGNAEHIYKNRVLHHGTLLFDSDLNNLGNAIRVVPGKYETKAVQSKRSEVANILPFLKNKMNVDEFIAFMLEVQLEQADSRLHELNDEDNDRIRELVDSRFSNWDWNFGYSPSYRFHHSAKVSGYDLAVSLEAEKGIITEADLQGNFYQEAEAQTIGGALVGKKHDFEEVKQVLGNVTESVVYTFF